MSLRTAGRWLGRNQGKALARILDPYLEPEEQLESWFIGVIPRRIGDKAREAAAAGAAMPVEQTIQLRLTRGATPPISYGSPFKGAFVVTDRSVLQVSTTLNDKPESFRVRNRPNFILGIGRTGDATRVGRYNLRQAAVLTQEDTLVFDLPADQNTAFDDFCERFVRLRDKPGLVPSVSNDPWSAAPDQRMTVSSPALHRTST